MASAAPSGKLDLKHSVNVATHLFLQNFQTLQKQSAEHSDPLYRLFFREGSIGSKLLSQVRKDLADVVKVCEGGLKQTNHLRTLMSSLTKGESQSFTQLFFPCC